VSAGADIPSRYALLPFFLIALLFVGAAPVFWLMTEVRQGDIAEAYENSDLYLEIYPTFHYGFGRLAQGEMPLWNPQQLCGVPFLPDPRVGLYQPLNVPFVYLSTARAMAVHSLLCLFLMGTFFALFARSLGVGYTACLVGGVAYAFCGASASAVSRPAMANALTWAPFVLWALREYGYRFRYAPAILAGVGAAMLLLSGATGVVVAMVVGVIGPYALLVALQVDSEVPLRRRLAALGLAAGIAVALSLVQWLPTCVWLLEQERPFAFLWNVQAAGRAPVRWRELLSQALLPGTGPLPNMGYAGIVVLLLAPACVFHRKRWKDAAFFAAAGAVSVLLLLAGANWFPLSLPPVAFAFPAALCLSVLVAIGAERLLAPYQARRSPAAWPAALLVLLLAGVLFVMSGPRVRGYLIVFVLSLAPFLLFRTRWSAVLCRLVLALLLFVELVIAGTNAYRHPYQDAPGCYGRYEPAVRAAQEQARGGRAVVSAGALDVGLPANVGLVWPLEVVGGAKLPMTRRQAAWYRHLPDGAGGSDGVAQRSSLALIDFMSGRVLLATEQGWSDAFLGGEAGGRFVARERVGEVRVCVNEEAVPRAYWAPYWRGAEGVDEAVAVLADPSFDSRACCVVDAASAAAYGVAREHMAGEASPLTRDDATCVLEATNEERLVVRVDAPVVGITVLSDTLAPGWRATLDGVRCPIVRTNGLFRGVYTPAGAHEIVLTYRPPGYRTGLVTSLLTGTLLVVLAAVAFFRGM